MTKEKAEAIIPRMRFKPGRDCRGGDEAWAGDRDYRKNSGRVDFNLISYSCHRGQEGNRVPGLSEAREGKQLVCKARPVTSPDTHR